MTRTVPVLAHTRRLPERKETVAFARTTEALQGYVLNQKLVGVLDEELQEAFADPSFATTFGMPD